MPAFNSIRIQLKRKKSLLCAHIFERREWFRFVRTMSVWPSRRFCAKAKSGKIHLFRRTQNNNAIMSIEWIAAPGMGEIRNTKNRKIIVELRSPPISAPPLHLTQPHLHPSPATIVSTHHPPFPAYPPSFHFTCFRVLAEIARAAKSKLAVDLNLSQRLCLCFHYRYVNCER